MLNEKDDFFDMPIMLDSKCCCFVDPKVSGFMFHIMSVLNNIGKDVMFKFNVQHDCRSAHCTISSDTEFMQQERHQTNIQLQSVKHTTLQRFIINTHSLHNGHLLRYSLPRDLTRPTPNRTFEERREFHKRISVELQVSGPARRAETQAKARTTRQQNKDARAAGAQGHGQAVASQVVGNTSTRGRGRGRGRGQGLGRGQGQIDFDADASDNDMAI